MAGAEAAVIDIVGCTILSLGIALEIASAKTAIIHRNRNHRWIFVINGFRYKPAILPLGLGIKLKDANSIGLHELPNFLTSRFKHDREIQRLTNSLGNF